MFYGEYEHTLDPKGRIIIPAKFRDIFKREGMEQFFLTRGLDRCLFLFPAEFWKAQEEQFRALSFTRHEARQFNRLYFSGAFDVSCDSQGRMVLPAMLKEYAAIKNSIVIVGVADRIEIWAREAWKDYYAQSLSSFEHTAEQLLEGPRQ